MSPERVSVGEGGGRSFHVEGPKTEKAWEPTGGESGATNLEAESIRSGARGEYGRVWKVEDSHRDKTEQCA